MTKKKLIEVALPLEAINAASAREKSIRHGHPSTLHLWFARRPLAACRAILFASLVDDPSAHPDWFPTEADQERERQRLFGIIERLVPWENSNDQAILDEARAEILRSTDGNPPPVLDPFCGGGSIPLEAQRLGLEAHGSDLNPVPVLITRALIEIPPKFAGQKPVNPEAHRRTVESWHGATGLAEDVRYYGKWMRDEAEKRIGHLYPKASLPKEYGGGEATVIAWIWARTVRCPNPACGATMPLVRSFALSTKPGKAAWVEPTPDPAAKRVQFTIKTGTKNEASEGTVGRRGARCLCCGSPVPLEHVRAEGKAKRMGAQLMAIVAEGKRSRIYLPPSEEHERIAADAIPEWVPDTELVPNSRHMTPVIYGMTTHGDLFTPRQLVALSIFSDLVGEAREKARQNAVTAGLPDNGVPLDECGRGATAYGDAVATCLAFAVDRLAMTGNNLVRWNPVGEKAQHAFGRQAIPMLWDFAEPNFFASATGSCTAAVELVADPLEDLGGIAGTVFQQDAVEYGGVVEPLICTDPPYYDNVPYADLSDFFYVWLRHSLASVYPSLFGTMLTPKAAELIADPFRQGSKDGAARFFEQGMRKVFARMRETAHPDFPLIVIYAFKQSESDEDGTDSALVSVASTGWETMLEGLLEAGFQITGTWPMRTEMASRMRGQNSNALASSIALVCRPRSDDAKTATRREFLNALRRELADALLVMMHQNIAPVDLAQASIGPGMAVYSRYARVVETDGKPLRVREALRLINSELDTLLAEHEGDYDADTRFCLAWFEQFGINAGAFGEADVMARAKNTSVRGLDEAGVLEARSGKVRLRTRDEYPEDWDPRADRRIPVWEMAQQFVRALDKNGEEGAARLYARLGEQAEAARDLAYRLYQICERKGWAAEARPYNGLVIAWPHIASLSQEPGAAGFNPNPTLDL